MAYIWGNLSLDLFTLVVVLIASVVVYFKWTFRYWEGKGVPQLKPSIPLGNIENPFSSTPKILGLSYKKFYKCIKAKGYKHGGFYSAATPQYIPIDLEYIKNILVKDFAYFADRGIYHSEKVEPISANLFNMEGNKWKNLRAKITPTFTGSKMKLIFSVLHDCAEELVEAVHVYCAKNLPIDIKEISGRYITDIIGSCAFGVDCNSLRDPDAEFRKYAKKLFRRTSAQKFRDVFTVNFPKLSEILRIKVIPKDMATFFASVTEYVVAQRKLNAATEKNDFLQLLLNLHKESGLTMDEMSAQTVMFFAAGSETSAALMCFSLMELSRHQDMQEKVREEIRSVLEKYDGKITYDGLMEMKYLDQVLDETLRLYPPGATLRRVCSRSYNVPGTNVVLDAGTLVFISILGIHHDDEYYPEHKKFDPERFNEETRSNCNPFTFLPFGDGPRNCIGLRFGLMQSKLGISMLLKNYVFLFNRNNKYPVVFDHKTTSYVSRDVIWLDVKKVNI